MSIRVMIRDHIFVLGTNPVNYIIYLLTVSRQEVTITSDTVTTFTFNPFKSTIQIAAILLLV